MNFHLSHNSLKILVWCFNNPEEPEHTDFNAFCKAIKDELKAVCPLSFSIYPKYTN